jgi:hypothetical protein
MSLDLFGNPIESAAGASAPAPLEKKKRHTGPPAVNPCIALYGQGPAMQCCKGCVHLRYAPARRVARYWKCDLRQLSHGAATDHKVNWPACGRYEKREQAYHGG